jgi:hypothetical protein
MFWVSHKSNGDGTMSRAIPAQDATIIYRGEAKFPTVGSQCNASCAFYAFCANSEDFGTCKGFILMNGQNLAQLKRNLDEDSIEYVKNSFPVIQRMLNNGHHDFAETVTRDVQRLGEIARPKTQTERKYGFMGMLEAAFGNQTEEKVEPKVVIRGFGRGFIGQLEEALTGTPKEEIKPTIVRRIPVGFKAMLEDAFGSQPIIRGYSEQLEKSKRRIPLGFKAMLEDAFDSQPTEQVEQPKFIIRSYGKGLIGMLEEVFRDR